MGSPHIQKSTILRKRITVGQGERRIRQERRTRQELTDILCCYNKTCGFKSTSEKSIRNHIKRVHIKHLQCEICGQRFGGIWELNRHMNPGTKPKSCVIKPFVKLTQDVISHGKRITGCSSLDELCRVMFSGPEKLYDTQDGTDNLSRGNNPTNESINQHNQTSNSGGHGRNLYELMAGEADPQPGPLNGHRNIAMASPEDGWRAMAGVEDDFVGGSFFNDEWVRTVRYPSGFPYQPQWLLVTQDVENPQPDYLFAA